MGKKLVCFVGLMAMCCPALAEEINATEMGKLLRKNLPPAITIQYIIKDKDLGLYRVITNDWTELFVTLDGKYFIVGEKWRIQTPSGFINLSQLEREKQQLSAVAQLPQSEYIVFPAKEKTKGWLVIFTDIDCGYCRTFHSEIDKVNSLGIEVRYAFFPRAGFGSNSYKKAVSVWCAKDQRQSMTWAKQGKEIPKLECANPVQRQYETGLRAGVKGTPTIFTSNGKIIPGYISPDRLAKTLGI